MKVINYILIFIILSIAPSFADNHSDFLVWKENFKKIQRTKWEKDRQRRRRRRTERRRKEWCHHIFGRKKAMGCKRRKGVERERRRQNRERDQFLGTMWKLILRSVTTGRMARRF